MINWNARIDGRDSKEISEKLERNLREMYVRWEKRSYSMRSKEV